MSLVLPLEQLSPLSEAVEHLQAKAVILKIQEMYSGWERLGETE